MKKISLYYLELLIMLLIVLSACSNTNWVAKVNGKKVSLKEFDVRYEYYLKSKYAQEPKKINELRYDLAEKKLCLNDMINERLVYDEAKKLGYHKREDIKNLINLYSHQIVLNAYIEDKLGEQITVGEKEIDDFYNKNRKKYQNVDAELARKDIRYQLMLQRYNEKIEELLKVLRKDAKIEENPVLFFGVKVEPGKESAKTNQFSLPVSPQK